MGGGPVTWTLVLQLIVLMVVATLLGSVFLDSAIEKFFKEWRK